MTNADRARELERVRKANRGVLRPEDVVEAAKPKSSPLHECFTWDDTSAAREHRLWQARHLIRVCVVMLNENPNPVRAYVSLMADRTAPRGGYRHVVEVMEDDEQRAQMMEEALDELRAFQSKYRRLKELAPVFEASDRVSAEYDRAKVGVA
jgi:hypothetical protein